jgi:hypothetical protein
MNLRTAVRHAVELVSVATLCILLSTTPAFAGVDEYSDYEPQTTCASTTKPGTDYLLRWLVRQYAHTGYSSTLRACDSGGTSEHKDGRALDWAVDAADPVQRAQAYAFLDRIFAADKAGNAHALARRMGIMYVIWDDHIWSSYNLFAKRDYLHSACTTRKTCSKTLRHRDHVHISLSRSGAAAQTSFYRARGVEPIPVLIPGTARLDPDRTAIVKLEVPATGETVDAGFKLTRGTTYRVVADGLYRFGAGSDIGDAACRWSGDEGWTASTTGLLLNGRSPWASACEGEHLHVASYTPRRTSYLRLDVGDPTPSDNDGTLSFYILREDLSARSVATPPPASGGEPRMARTVGPSAKRLTRENVTVRAAARRGVLTDRAMRKGRKYRVVVTGVAKNGGTPFDAGCVRYAGRFRAQHTLDLTKPTADHLSLFVQGVRVGLRAGTSTGCNTRTHRYVGTYKAVVGGRARLAIWDPYRYDDNSGALTVALRLR